MNEAEAVQKMRDLQNSLETSMRYSQAGKRFPGVFLLILAGVLISFLVVAVSNLAHYFSTNPGLSFIPLTGYLSIDVNVVVAILWMVLAIFVYRILTRSFRSVESGKWEKDLEDGIPGILKIVESEDWDGTLIDLRKAKISFIVIGILQFLLYWALAAIAISFVYDLIVMTVFGVLPDLNFISFVAALLVLGLGDSAIRRSYHELWYMDGLVAELRWFYLEFQGSGL